MTRLLVSFRVAGTPVAKGSKRAVPIRAKDDRRARIAVVEQPHVRDWELTVREVAHEAAIAAGLTEPSNAPVEVELTFAMIRPRGHYRTGKREHELRDSAPMWPAVKPDIDKLARTILDGITGVLLTDDARVVRLVARKVYGWPAGCDVLVWRMPA